MEDDRWPIEERDLSELCLDPLNVRIANPQAGESSIAAYLVAAEDVAVLAVGIARDGYLDNELPVVTFEDGRLMVLEGNRRVTALKLLTGTLAADDPGGVAFSDVGVERVARRYPRELPTSIRVMVAPSREAAQPLLARLHTSNPKKSWLREQQAIFYHAQLDRGRTVDDLRVQFPSADDIPRFIRMGEMRALIRGLDFKDDALKDWILESRLPMTSFEYAYRSPDVLSALGLAFTTDGLLVDSTLTEGQSDAIQYLLARFKDKTLNTRSLEFKAGKKGEAPNAARTAFLDALRGIVNGENPEPPAGDDRDGDQDAPDPVNPGTDAVDGDSSSPPDGAGGSAGDGIGGGDPGTGGSGTGAGSRGPNRGDTRRRLDMNGFAYQGASPGMRRRFEELRQIDVETFANAAYDLLRTVLECSGKVYLRAHAPARLQPGATLTGVLTALKQEFASDSYVRGILNQIDAGGPRSSSAYAGTAQSLNAMNHEPDHFVRPAEVHAAWDRIKPLVIRLLA
ncbi:hypothetical protein [Tessaracoccus lacteus]|uniref:ParB/Sulfiredoxin domain-containing protein n=1 Tax=Tessaracoccus lacteus TaxID=3041766 RepID=A0ABY8Q127_9ACTN|nr:hypothetical protein [Tessaracoccus sp. T21]WGT48417.1 hypothetical protein QH948_06670 [Tessaracoccus sp. T21]